MADVLGAMGYMFGFYQRSKLKVIPRPKDSPRNKTTRPPTHNLSDVDRTTITGEKYAQLFGCNVNEIWNAIENIYT